MLVSETIARIRRDYFDKGKPIKEIVRDVKVLRNTIRKVIRMGATSFSYDHRDNLQRAKGGSSVDASVDASISLNGSEHVVRCGHLSGLMMRLV